MFKIIKISFLITIVFLILIIFYLTKFGIKTNQFNSFIENKVKDYDKRLSINLQDVFFKINLQKRLIIINSKNPKISSGENIINFNNIDINLDLIKFIKNEKSTTNIKFETLDNSIEEVISILNSINNKTSSFLFSKKCKKCLIKSHLIENGFLKKGIINFKANLDLDTDDKKNNSFTINGKVKNAQYNFIVGQNMNNINFDFKIINNFVEIIDLNFNHHDINFNLKLIELKKLKSNSFHINGHIENEESLVNPVFLYKIFHLKKGILSNKHILLKSKNIFSFNIDKNKKIQNLKIDSNIYFDELYSNERLQNLIFLRNGLVNLKFENNVLKTTIRSNFSFIKNKKKNITSTRIEIGNTNHKENYLELSGIKKGIDNIKFKGTIRHKQKLINTKDLLSLFRLNEGLFIHENINIASDSKFKFEVNDQNQIEKYKINSSVNLDKLALNKDFHDLVYLKNIRADVILSDKLLKMDLLSNYSFFNKKYNNIQDNNTIKIKLDKKNKELFDAKIFLDTNDNKINLIEFKKYFNLQSKIIKNQIVKLNSNFFINFSFDNKFKISDLNLKSEIKFDNLKINYKSKQIKKYFTNYENNFVVRNPKISIEYLNDILNLKIDGKYSLRDNYDNFFIKVIGNKSNLEIYTLLDINEPSLNVHSIDYLKKSKIPSQLEFIANFSDSGIIIKNAKFSETNNKVILNNLQLSDNYRIIKIDDINFNFLNNKRVLNNLNLERDLNNYKVTGKNYDVEAFLQELLKNNKKKNISKFFKSINGTISFDIKNLYLEENSNLHNVSGEIDIKNNKLFLAKISADLNKKNKFTYSFRTTQKNEKITNIFIDEPEPFINNYKFIKGFEEGELKLNSMKIDNTSRSNLKITNFKIKEVPILAKILTLASLQGIADLLTGEGIRFDDFEMDFKTKNNLIEINEMYAIGPAISILMEGYIEKNRVTSLRGTLVPATTINKSIAKIPLLGNILVGSKTGEGIFGVSFKIKGPPNDLKSTVNPIKTLTPRFITRTLEKIKGN